MPELPDVPERRLETGRSRTGQFNREMEARVRVGGSITVAEDEHVTGAVVAVAGSVTVNGRVNEDVVAVGGNVRLGRRAEVRGDVVVVGGTIEREPGAVVHGKVSEVAFMIPGLHIRPNWNAWSFPWFDSGQWRAFRLFASLVRMALFALLATLILLLAPGAVQRVEMAVTTQFWKSALVGLLAQLFFVPVLVLTVVVLAVSIIGIPLLVLVPFGILAFFVALLLGLTGAASGLARVIQNRSSWTTPTSFAPSRRRARADLGDHRARAAGRLGGGPLAAHRGDRRADRLHHRVRRVDGGAGRRAADPVRPARASHGRRAADAGPVVRSVHGGLGRALTFQRRVVGGAGGGALLPGASRLRESEDLAVLLLDITGRLPSLEQDQSAAERESEQRGAEQEQPGDARRAHEDVSDADFLRRRLDHLHDDGHERLGGLHREHGRLYHGRRAAIGRGGPRRS